MDGPTATAHLRALGCTTPIFGCTGMSSEEEVLRFTEAGATEVFGKPFDVDRFQACMRRLVGEGK